LLNGSITLKAEFFHQMASVNHLMRQQMGECQHTFVRQIFTSRHSFGRAEGVAVIVLKPEENALRDGEKIYGTILGTGINSSGSIAPVNAPVASAQEDAMSRAFRMAGVSPTEVDFLELHATGTARGDPTEANWVGNAFKRDGDILLGSVKGNIGYVI
jgi:acyl transferase domain-containing protein